MAHDDVTARLVIEVVPHAREGTNRVGSGDDGQLAHRTTVPGP